MGTPATPLKKQFLGGQKGKKVVVGARNIRYNILRVGGDVESYSAETYSGKFSLMSMGGRAEGLVCAHLGARTPIAVSRKFV